MTTEEGIVGLGEPLLEGRSLTCQTAVQELEPWLIGRTPTRVVHLWQSMYKHAFYRGGDPHQRLSGVEQALWDCYGKLLGLPVYRLLGGPRGSGCGSTARPAGATRRARRRACGRRWPSASTPSRPAPPGVAGGGA